MNRKYFNFLILSLLCATLSIESAVADSGMGYIALVVELKGTVLIKRKNGEKFEKAIWGSYVYEGDQVQTKAKSKTSLLFSNGNIIALNENGSITLMKQGQKDKLTALTKESKQAENMSPEPERLILDSLAYRKLIIRRTKSGKIQVYPGVRSPGETILYPRQTYIRNRQPDFIWRSAYAACGYKIVFYNADKWLWSTVTTDTMLQFPAGQSLLEYDQSYTWSLYKIDRFDTIKIASTYFHIPDFDTIQRIIKIENNIKNMRNDFEESYCEFLKAVAYEKFGLRFEAVSQFEYIAGQNPKSSFPYDAIARLYDDTGLHNCARRSSNTAQKQRNIFD